MERRYSFSDRLCIALDQAIKTLSNQAKTTGAPFPAEGILESLTDEKARRTAACLMRVNHAGEICAQALYHGQGMVSRSHEIKAKMNTAAIEEGDHLVWCERRLSELNSHTSYLNPLWYMGSICIGVMAGMIGDHWSLGFVAETERQVIRHLEKQLQLLPQEDQRSHKILQTMERDEAKHRDEALASGAPELPEIIKKTMTLTAKMMVKTSYWV